jgi:AraC-like DNA-binding protein
MLQYLKPALKKVEPEFGSSFVLREFYAGLQKPFWHFHPEVELAYIEKGKGKRHVGNHISYFNDGDLIMIGANLPHYGCSSGLTGDNREIVAQINESCFGNGFLDMVETSSIRDLFEKSKLGLSYYGNTKAEVGERLQSMFHMTSFEKLIELMKILHLMSLSDEYEILNASGSSLQVTGDDNHRIDVIYDFVRTNFESKITVDEIAAKVNMSTPAFCRFFKKSTAKTFIQFVNEYRIAHACKLISEESTSIADVAFECGFQNLSNFNRAFKKVAGKSPSDYRQGMRRVVV